MIKSVIRYVGIIAIVILSSCAPKAEQTSAIVLQTLSAQPTFLREPYTTKIEIEEIVLGGQKTVFRNGPKKSGGVSWVAGEVDAGSPKKQINEYTVVYDLAGQELSRTLNLDKVEIVDAKPRVFEYGAKPTAGTVFYPSKIYRYGANCRGCRPNADGIAHTASGVGISAQPQVRQMNGSFKDGITYEGYYVMASDRSLPMCSILEISNHKFSGSGLKPGVPFKAIVLDRGVSGRVLDLFVGDETRMNDIVRMNGKQYPMAKIIGKGKVGRNAQGQKTCIVD